MRHVAIRCIRVAFSVLRRPLSGQLAAEGVRRRPIARELLVAWFVVDRRSETADGVGSLIDLVDRIDDLIVIGALVGRARTARMRMADDRLHLCGGCLRGGGFDQ
jgi:hypothetical protein